jgi:4-amino-4-deoxy-L-arabinose transferase-like glycosyltransferase
VVLLESDRFVLFVQSRLNLMGVVDLRAAGFEDGTDLCERTSIDVIPAHATFETVPGAAAPPRRSHRVSAGWLILAWIGAGIVLVSTLAIPSVDRAQEARVLETAREMMDASLRGWMIPVLNGKVRLEKPPLAYWLAAGGFKLLGVHVWAGRLPFAILAWLAVGLTYVFAARLFGRFAAFVGAGTLLGCLMFAHHARLAETDVLVLLFVTAAVYAFWRGTMTRAEEARSRVRWFYAASAAVGLAVLSKGPPAVFPVLFFGALVWKTRRWDRLWQWVQCGAPLLALAIGAPWFIYVIHAVGYETMLTEARIATLGEEHRGWFIEYLPQTLVAMAPWSALAVMAVWMAITRWRKDPRIVGVLLWLAAVMIPLCVAGQKQKHYLMPALPPLAILTGWFIDRALRARRRARFGDLGKILQMATVAVCGLGTLVAPIAGRMVRGRLMAMDVALPVVAVSVLVIFTLFFARNRVRAAAVSFVIGAAILTTLMDGVWAPTLKAMPPERMAALIRSEFGDRPYRFYGTPTLPLIFALRSVALPIASESELAAAATSEPNAIVFVPVENEKPPLTQTLPALLVERRAYKGSDKTIRVCEFKGR